MIYSSWNIGQFSLCVLKKRVLLLSNTILFNFVCGILSWNSYLYVFMHLNSLEIFFSLTWCNEKRWDSQTDFCHYIWGLSIFSFFVGISAFGTRWKWKAMTSAIRKQLSLVSSSCILSPLVGSCWRFHFLLKEPERKLHNLRNSYEMSL